MKNLVFLFLLLPAILPAQKRLVLTGKVTGLKERAVVVMTDINKPTDTLAKAVVKKGVFVLRHRFEEPMIVNLKLGGQATTMAFLDNSTARMTGNIKTPAKIVIRGSSVNTDFQTFQTTFDPIFSQMRAVNQQLQMNGNSDSLNMLSKNLIDSVQTNIDRFIAKRTASPVSAFILAATLQLSDDINRLESRLNSLKTGATNNLYANYLREMIAEAKVTAIGSTAAGFSQADTSGNPVSLASFRGKYVLIDFWASWCGPCRQENPNVVANYRKFMGKNFTVLGVSLDRPNQKDRWIQAIHADNLTWTHVSDLQYWNNEVAKQYRVQSIPQNFLIGPDGKILAKNLRGPALEAKLCELLGCGAN